MRQRGIWWKPWAQGEIEAGGVGALRQRGIWWRPIRKHRKVKKNSETECSERILKIKVRVV